MALPVVITDNQKVQDGDMATHDLRDSVELNNVLIPKERGVFGACQIVSRRLLVEIENIRWEG